ncbi:MAG: N,N-dimethylformamidase beta subunit family domain-containing protein [Limisphaerales bacterium]
MSRAISFVLAISVAGLVPAAPHQAIRLKGLHAYADDESVAAGEVIRFQVSSEVPYRLRVTKLGLKVDDRSSDETFHLSPKTYPAKVQSIHPGSYVRVAKKLPNVGLEELTLECWVRPWRLNAWQGVLTQHDYPDQCGVGLFINGEGQASFYVGSGGEYDRRAMVSGGKLKVRQWYHLVGTWNGHESALWVNGKKVGVWSALAESQTRQPGKSPLRVGAYGQSGNTSSFLDGDIAMPAIYSRALGAEEIIEQYNLRGLVEPDREGLLACWPLMEERGAKVADSTGNGYDGEIVNLGTWMIGGPSFDGTRISRYADYDPKQDHTRGHGLRLASDDLYDCGWSVTQEYRVPKNAKSGLYAGWFEFELNGKPHRYPVTFIVNKAPKAKKAPLAMLCATTTWRAYSGANFAKNVPRENRFWSTSGQVNDPSNPTAYNMYRDHRYGQPAYQVGLRMPWPAAGPEIRYSKEQVDYSHLMRGERFTHVWLEKQGYDFDVYSSLDLHRDPNLLNGYRALIINGHDEYWSKEMYEGVDRYLTTGGSVAVLSGNTMFWRVTFDEELGTMECRKYGPGIGGRKFANVGEIWHSYDSQRGSLMRNCGYPSWKVIGLDCSGWWGGANNGVYTPTKTDHFLFQTPEKVSFADRGTFGHAPSGYRRAGGHEGDIRLSSFAKPVKAIPDGGVFPAEPKGIETVANIKRKNARALDYFANFGKVDEATLVDMIWWERPQGGKVFHAGAIAWGWTLDVDPKQTKIMRNVLFHLTGLKASTPYDP